MEAVTAVPQISVGAERSAFAAQKAAPLGLYNGLRKASSGRVQASKRATASATTCKALKVTATAAVETAVKSDQSTVEKVSPRLSVAPFPSIWRTSIQDSSSRDADLSSLDLAWTEFTGMGVRFRHSRVMGPGSCGE